MPGEESIVPGSDVAQAGEWCKFRVKSANDRTVKLEWICVRGATQEVDIEALQNAVMFVTSDNKGRDG
jgi:hypothetical protein